MQGQRQTRQKQLILGALCELNHPTATAVYNYIHTDHPTVSRATVFRVLKQAEENGSIARLSFATGEDRFDFNPAPHYHVRCIFCHKVSDVKMPFLKDPQSAVEDAYGFKILSHELEFKGVCPDCAKKSAQ